MHIACSMDRSSELSMFSFSASDGSCACWRLNLCDFHSSYLWMTVGLGIFLCDFVVCLCFLEGILCCGV